ncbi:MAG: lipopolysaccharide kinase InaA family protein [Planctomycetota bacterium]
MTPFSVHQAVFSLGETLWNLYGDLRDMLFDARGLRLEEWKQQGRATLVKNGSGRTIYHVRLPGLDMYVKHFRAATPMNLLHQIVRQGRAEKEFHLAHLLNTRGVSTIRPIALGERRKHGMLLESYLLTEAIPNGLTLFELIERCVLTGRMPFPPKNRFYFAEQLARLAATIHETGIEHRDLHERNIIIQPAADGEFRFFILDLHELRVHREVSWQCASKELSRMGRYFTLRTSASDRLRFFLHYARFRGFSEREARKLAKEVEYSTVESRADFWRRRDTRPQRKNQKFDYYKSKDTVAHTLPEIPAETVQMLMDNPDGPFLDSLVHWWKIGRATRVAEVELPQIRASDSLIYKQYYFKGWHESLASIFHPNQATRAWNAGAALLLRELPTPRPLMLIHKMRHGMPVTSYLLTERVPGAQTITRFLDRHLPELDPVEQKRVRRGVLRESAMLLRKLHDRRATHRDLKASNILLSTTDDLARPKLWLIDLDGVQTWQTVPEKHRLQNLTRFYVSFHQNPWLSLTDRLRFLRIYLARDFKDKSLWKRYWKEIHAQTEKKISRNLRQGRTVV